jgi:hypothetical protein
MENGFHIGKIESKNIPVDCKINNNSAAAASGWACDNTKCFSYGNWCPFSW